MATTHVFIVDSNTFKYHLEYMFAGTGAGNNSIDFNNSSSTILHNKTESNLIGMIADISRVRIGDYIIFYLQNNSGYEGKFYGIFKAKSESFLDNFKHYNSALTLSIPYNFSYPRDSKKFKVNNTGVEINDILSLQEIDAVLNNFTNFNDKELIKSIIVDYYLTNQYLLRDLNKSLTFRILIEPYQVFKIGVTEWEALDEIKTIVSPYQMLWSLIYRKLKGNRGCTMITMYESEKLFRLIKLKNLNNSLSENNFSFDSLSQKIIPNQNSNNYIGSTTPINVLPRLIYKNSRRTAFESHLQAYIVQNIGKGLCQSLDQILLNSLPIEWIGNEVSCGVGMQRIDIMLSLVKDETNKICIPIELKAVEAYLGITKQLQRYVDWLEQYYIPNSLLSQLQPVIISKKINNKTSTVYSQFIEELNTFNTKNNDLLKTKYVEYEVVNDNLVFSEIIY